MDEKGNEASANTSNATSTDMDVMEFDENEITEVIDLPEEPTPEDELADMDDLDIDEAEHEGDNEDSDTEDMELPPVPDLSKYVFSKHTGSVFCIDLSPDAKLVISGGEDDKAYVWRNNEEREVLLECSGHKDSVTCVGFSHDVKYVVTGDMSGLIKVWLMETMKEIWSFEVGDLEWLKWHHSAHVLLAGTHDGELWMWKIPSGEAKTMEGHGSPCSAGVMLQDGKHLCTGYEDGTLKIWDLKSAHAAHKLPGGYHGHYGPVTTLACHHRTNTILSGSTDRRAKLIDANSGKVLSTYYCGEKTDAKNTDESVDNSLEAIAFCKSHNLVACGTLKGILTIWNTKAHSVRHTCKHQAGITSLKWHENQALIVTGTLDGVVHLWDAMSGEKIREWTGHQAEILDLQIAKTNECIVTSSGDHTVRVYDT